MERHRGTASSFHARELPESATRAVWVHDVSAPAVVLGSAQRDDLVDRQAATAAGVEVVRRRSGGGAVLLVPGEVVWVDVLLPRGDPLWVDDVGRSTTWLGEAWAEALGEGAEVHRGGMVHTPWSALVCFAGLGPGEVTRSGHKLVGISQRRTREAARFQCAVYSRWDPSALAAVLRLEPEDRTRLVEDLASAVAPARPAVDEFLDHLETL